MSGAVEIIQPPLDLSALEEKALDLLRSTARDRAADGEDCPGFALAFAPDGIHALQGLGVIPTANQRRAVLQTLLRRTHATALIVLVECWMATTEAGAGRDSLPANLADAPGRVSTLVCILEHSGGSRTWSVPTAGGEIRAINLSSGGLFGLLEWN